MKNNIGAKFLLLFMFVSLGLNLYSKEKKSIVVVSAGRNNFEWYKKHLDSFFSQDYDPNKCRMIYIDDNSSDGSADLVEAYVKKNGQERRVEIIKNETRKFHMENQYNAIYSCKDDDIIVILDSDDWFSYNGVLSYLNKVYSENDIWMTYGQYKTYPNNRKGECCSVPQKVIDSHSFREFGHVFSALRTFYAKLFKLIDKRDLMYEGVFLREAGDVAIMFPMIEMSNSGHFKFITKVLYVYNIARQIYDNKAERCKYQRRTSKIIRSMEPYKPLKHLF